MMYAFSENYILPISHDEVVHGKASLISKMPGAYEDKFAGVRSFMGYMMSHPGKKLNFMGSEFGQFKEWDYINHFYLDTPAFYEIEDSWDGFEWLAPNDADRNFISYIRKDKQGNQIVVLINFSGVELTNYTLGIEKGKYKLIFNTDSVKYGGSGVMKKRIFTTTKTPSHGKEYSIKVDIPKLTCVYLTKID